MLPILYVFFVATRNKSNRIHHRHRSNEYDSETESAATTKYDGRMARPIVAEENYAAVSANLGHNPHEDTTPTGQNRTTEI